MSRKVLDLSAPPPPPANAWGKKPTQSTPSTKPTPPKPTPPKSAPSSQTQSPQSSQPSGHVSAASGPPPPQPKGWTTLSKDSNKPSDTKNRINVNRGETFPIGSPALRQWVTNQSKRFTPDFAVLIDAFVTDPDMGEIREFANGVLGASPKLNDFLIELERKRGGLSSSSSSSPSSSVSNEAAWKSSASGTEGKNSGEQGPPPPPGTLQRQVSTDLLNDRNDLIKGPTLGGFLGASHELKERNQNQGGNAFGGGKSLSSKKESRIEDLIRPNSHVDIVVKKSKAKKPATTESGKTSAAKVTFKGRVKCGCAAKSHPLLANCTACGRIVCEAEGEGNCFYCGSYVTKDFTSTNPAFMKALEQVLPPPAQARLLRAIKSGSKYRNTSDEGMFGLTDGSWMEVTDDVDEAEEIAAEMVALARERTGEADATMQEGKVKAEKHRDGLLARTKKATAVIDEQGDFYEYESNRWMDAREKELARQRAEAVEEFIQAKRKQRLLEITFGPGGEVSASTSVNKSYMNTDAATIAGKRREEVLREFDEAEKKKRAEMERLARKQGLLNVEQTEEENSWLGGGAGISMSQAIEGSTYANPGIAGRARAVYELIRAEAASGIIGSNTTSNETKESHPTTTASTTTTTTKTKQEGVSSRKSADASSTKASEPSLAMPSRPSVRRVQHEYEDLADFQLFAHESNLESGDGSNEPSCIPKERFTVSVGR